MPSQPNAKISCRNVWKVYARASGVDYGDISGQTNPSAFADEIRKRGDIVAAANINFDIHEGEIFIIMGLSGSGKSTLLRCMSRLV